MVILMRIGMLTLILFSAMATYKDKYEIAILMAIWAILLHQGALEVEKVNNK